MSRASWESWIREADPPVPPEFFPFLRWDGPPASPLEAGDLLRQAVAELQGALRAGHGGPGSSGADSSSEGVRSGIGDGGEHSLDPTSEPPSSTPREGAFRLLAADALVTWAAELALEAQDPEAELTAMATGIVEGARSPDPSS